jgi:DNA invertase Pin-like site-specific DNA recombinase
MPNLSEAHRKLVCERIKLGIAKAKENGKTLGRPRIITPENCEQVRVLKFEKEYPAWKILRRLKMQKSTYYSIIILLKKNFPNNI